MKKPKTMSVTDQTTETLGLLMAQEYETIMRTQSNIANIKAELNLRAQKTEKKEKKK